MEEAARWQRWPWSNARGWQLARAPHPSHTGDEVSLPPHHGRERATPPKPCEDPQAPWGAYPTRKRCWERLRPGEAGDGFPQAASPVSPTAAPRSGWDPTSQCRTPKSKTAVPASPPSTTLPTPGRVAGVPPFAPSLHETWEPTTEERGVPALSGLRV